MFLVVVGGKINRRPEKYERVTTILKTLLLLFINTPAHSCVCVCVCSRHFWILFYFLSLSSPPLSPFGFVLACDVTGRQEWKKRKKLPRENDLKYQPLRHTHNFRYICTQRLLPLQKLFFFRWFKIRAILVFSFFIYLSRVCRRVFISFFPPL